MATSSSEKYIPVRALESTEEHMTQGGTYTATVWSEPSGLWAASVNGPDGASVCHGLLSREAAQAWSKAQAAAFASRAKAEAQRRQ